MINHFRLFSVWVVRSADTWPSRMRVKNGRFSLHTLKISLLQESVGCRATALARLLEKKT